jgi:hypothetical protein
LVAHACGGQIVARSRQRSAGRATVDLCDNGIGFVGAGRLFFVDAAFELLKGALAERDKFGSSIDQGFLCSIDAAFPELSSIEDSGGTSMP